MIWLVIKWTLVALYVANPFITLAFIDKPRTPYNKANVAISIIFSAIVITYLLHS